MSFDEDQAHEIVYGIAQGLQDLSDCGVEMLVNPKNIMITDKMQVKLAPFGFNKISEVEAPDHFSDHYTYVPNGERLSIKEQNVWAIGVILHEILFQESPKLQKKNWETGYDCH